MIESPAGSSFKGRRLLIISALCGIFGIIISMSMIMLAIQLSPWFSWNTNVISDLGVHDVSALFNSAIILAGILTIIFIVGLRHILFKGRIADAAIISLLLGSLCLVLIGIFTLQDPLIHTVVAYGYFTLTPVGILLIAYGSHHKSFRWFSFVVGASSLLAIYILPLALAVFNVGFGIPELVETTLLEIWVVAVAIIMLRSPVLISYK